MSDTRPPHLPTDDDIREARANARAVAEQTYQVAADALPRNVRRIAQKEATRTARWIGIVGALFAVLLSLGVSTAALSSAMTARAQSQETQRTVEAALARLEQANTTLESRGQEPIPAPPSPDPTEAIAAAVLAQVLASLPPSPTADEVAGRIQSAVVSSLIGPTGDELAGLVASYFQTHPPRPGPPPSQEAIQAAVDAAYAANPPADGRDGVDGQSPPCLSEPRQCRGEDGEDGADSTVPGPPGPTCPADWSLDRFTVVTTTGPVETVLCQPPPAASSPPS